MLTLLLATLAIGSPSSLVGITNNADGLNGAPPGSGTFTRHDPTTGELIDAYTVTNSGVATAWAESRDTVFAVHHNPGNTHRLVEIDPLSLRVVRDVGIIHNAADSTEPRRAAALIRHPDGRLFGVDARRTLVAGLPVPIGMLIEIDPLTGAARDIGSLGIPIFSRGAAYHDGSLILVTTVDRHDEEILAYRVNLSTGNATLLGSTGVFGRAVGAAHDPQGRIWASLGGSSSSVYELNPFTGAASLRFSTGFSNISGLTWVTDIWVRRVLPRPGGPSGDADIGSLNLDRAGTAHAQIGAMGDSRTYELSIGRTTSARDDIADYPWVSGAVIPFELSWDSSTDQFRFIVDGHVLTTSAYRDGRDLLIRGNASRNGSRAQARDLRLNGTELGFALDTNIASGHDGLHLHTPWLDESWVLTGQMILSWEERRRPQNSQLDIEFGWGEARNPWR